MANKRSKACQQNKKSVASNRNPGVLPRQFLSLMSRPGRPSWWPNGVRDTVVTKSWESLPRECPNSSFAKTLPLVQVHHTIDHIFRVQTCRNQMKCNKKNKQTFDRSHSLKYMGSTFEGSIVWSEGFRLGPLPYNRHYYSTGSSHFEAPKSGIHRACIAFYSHANSINPNTRFDVVLTGISSPTILIEERPTSGNNYDKSKWVKYGFNLVDPHDPGKGYMRLCSGIWFRDKLYALSLQGTLVVLQFGVDHCPFIVALGSSRAVPSSTTSSRHFREYLLEANGQILLVFLLYKKSIKIVDDVEVFELDVSSLSWVKMTRLGDTISLFLGKDCCMAVDTSKLDSGCDSSCVYFNNLDFDGWKVYNMKKGCIEECKFEFID